MGKQANLYSFASNDQLVASLREHVVEAQNAGIRRHDVFKVAVSGGSLPTTLAQALLLPPPPAASAPSATTTTSDSSGDALPNEVRFDKWEIFFADERAVPLDHEDSNYALVKRELLDRLAAERQQHPLAVHPIDVAHLDDAQELADQYEQTLVRSFASRDSVKQPIFDLILLGCGPDGHTCSLFPGHELLRETVAWVAPIEDSPKPPARRITLTLPVVIHAVKVTFVATGAGKRDALKRAFEEDHGGDLPCGLVSDAVGDRCSWFVDDAAVEGVNYPRRSTL